MAALKNQTFHVVAEKHDATTGSNKGVPKLDRNQGKQKLAAFYDLLGATAGHRLLGV